MKDANGWPVTLESMSGSALADWNKALRNEHHIASRNPATDVDELVDLCRSILRSVGEMFRRQMYTNEECAVEVSYWNNLMKTYQKQEEEMSKEELKATVPQSKTTIAQVGFESDEYRERIDTTLALKVRDKINEALCKNFPDADDQLVTVEDPANVRVSLDLDNPNHPDMGVFGIIRNALNDCKAARSVKVDVFLRTVSITHFSVGGS